jgi:alpha-amylase/alpha-mannosidase (GH57 family)
MDGENAWEYYPNDGHDFLELFYKRLSESKFIQTTTIKEYLETHNPTNEIKRIAAGSWIYANFNKWIGDPYKNKAWECLALAREELESYKLQAPCLSLPRRQAGGRQASSKLELAYKQIYIAEGSDWFWWYGENHADFDLLFRMHLANFYTIIGKDIPDYLKSPLTAN